MDKLLDMVPETVKAFGTPLISLVLLVLSLGFSDALVAATVSYVFMATTAITGYVEYRKFTKRREAEEKKLPVTDLGRHDGSP